MPDEVRLSAEQLEKLVAEGAITADQREELLRKSEATRSRFSLPTIAYYFGGFIVLLTYFSASAGVFAAGAAGPLAWGLLTMALTGAAGAYLWRRTSHRLAGEMLLVVAGSMVPYTVFTLFHMAGLLEGGDTYEEFINNVQPSFLTATAVTAALLLAALALTRAPLLTIVLTAVVYVLILDLAAWVGVRADSSGYVEGVMTTAFAVPFGLAALWMERRARDNYAFWLAIGALAAASTGLETIGGAAAYDTDSTFFPVVTGLLTAALWLGTGVYTQLLTKRGTENVFYVVGSLSVLVAVGVPCFMYDSHLVNITYLLANVALIVGGVSVQRRVPVIAGAIGAYVYLAAESDTVFGSNAQWFMTVTGVAIIAAALFYERLRSRPNAGVEA